MGNTLLEKEAERLMKIPGNVRGVPLLTTAAYVRYRQGEEGVKLLEEKMKELGYPLRYEEINSLDWYPAFLHVLAILVAKELFGWTDPDIFDMGNSAPKYSFIVRMLIKTFLSLRKAFEESPKHWRKHYDFGELVAKEMDEKKKYLVLQLKRFKFHPLMCNYYAGYFLRIAQYTIKSQKITNQETKCIHRGDSHHEYLIKWE